MDDIKQLIETARRGGVEAKTAAAHLIELGSRAAPAVIEEVRRSPLAQIKTFTDILLQMKDPDVLPLMVGLLDEDNVDLKLAAYEALGRSRDARALQPLLNRLLDTNKTDFTRSLAARALGEMGNSEAKDKLLGAVRDILFGPGEPQEVEKAITLLRDEFDEDRLRLALEITVALAKLGDHQLLPVATSILLRRDDQEESVDDSIIRAEAARALQYVVGPGTFPALQAALRDSDPEVRQEAAEAIFYLGVKEAIGELILLVEDEYEDIAGNALSFVYGLTGEWPNEMESLDNVRSEELLEWWEKRQKDFASGICYRLGKPLWLPDVIALLKEAGERTRVLKELRVISGQDFSSDVGLAEGNAGLKAQKWLEENIDHLERGQLYKYGYKQNIQNIF